MAKPKTGLPFLEVDLLMNRIFKKHEKHLSEDRIGERRMPSESGKLLTGVSVSPIVYV